ncbi:MAG: glutamine-hydrolyzing carbamoyl-phosphate synthase small subunit [Methanomassiliicoccaceae archaeon]|jgi:carbamoyl-phosphate synthase small subunit|nr:glutamine-hydrolyzing carbamoyl-phosphate synthase small subunit [Methanomassiliicoccaceae archaeon]
MVRCFLVLEDGTALEGVSFGHESAVLGEMVFTTSMSGYQESITDPAYKGQIIVSAFPMVGCYGMNGRFENSDSIHAAGLVVRKYCDEPSDMYGGETLGNCLRKNKVPGISGIDTRDVVTAIRDNGSMSAAIVFDESDISSVKKKLKEKRKTENLVTLVSSKKIIRTDNKKKVTIGLIDCGTDRNLIRDLSDIYNVIVFPYDTKAKDIIDSNVKAVIISNGPGDPSHPEITDTVTATVREIFSKLPIAGISFGAQVIASAFGCRIIKLKFGHHGSNQPVRHEKRAYITYQNHMFTIDADSMNGTELIADHFNVNDGTVEGFTHKELPIFGIQYYPIPRKYEQDSFFYKALERIIGVKP